METEKKLAELEEIIGYRLDDASLDATVAWRLRDECLRLMAEQEWVKVSPETKDSSHKNIESLRRQDGTIYARKCLDCGATWKIYQKPCHSSHP